MGKKMLERVLFFKGAGNAALAVKILRELREYLGHTPVPSHLHFGRWGDGELEDRFPNYKEIKGKTVVFFECLKEESVMLRFLQLCWAAKHQYGAERIIAVLFFMHYRRQDHEDREGEIKRNRWLVEMMKASGVDHVILVTPHSRQTVTNFEDNNVECRCVDLSDLFASRLKPYISRSNKNKAKVYAPDEGSIIRAVELAKRMKVGVLFSLKNRGFNNETAIVEADQQKIEKIKEQFSAFPDLEYATSERIEESIIIMIEDEIDSGGTAYTQAVKLRKNGAKKIYAVFSHAVCTDPWRRKLFGADNPFTQVIVCDTVPRGEEKRTGGKVHDVSVAVPVASELFILLEEIFTLSAGD